MKSVHGAVAEAADQVLFYENGVWQTLWLSGQSGSKKWVAAGDTSLTSQDGKIIPPGIGLMVKTTGSAKAVTLTGHVRVTPWLMPLEAGQNLLALPWPVDGTPRSLGLTVEQGFAATTSTLTADQLQLWKADTTPGAAVYDAYWYLKKGTTALWTAKGSASLIDVTATLPLPAHRAFFLKAQPATAAKGWRVP